MSTSVEFGRVFKRPVRSADRYFTALGTPGPAPQARLGLAIAKKQARRAVDRSRLKRLVREAFRRIRPELGPVDIVIMARPDSVDAPNAVLLASLSRHFRRIATETRLPFDP